MQDIDSWLAELGLEKYTEAFAEAEIDLEILPNLVEDNLKELGLPLGPRLKISAAIERLGEPPASTGEKTKDDGRNTVTANATATSSDAERRHLTVMFIDLVGSTEMATRMDAEDMRNVITGYQNTVAGVVGRYEGFVAKFMGDGVMCYFGWPRAGEDDAERAVRAGLAIIDSVRTTKAPDGTALATRIGVATGVVIVGDLIGSGATQEAAVVGETPNLAARLQGIAQPNQLVLPQETRRLLGNTYKLTSIGAQDLKGVGTPVEAFVAEGEAVQESRFAARQSGTLTPIVGRDREIELMLERWTLAKSGQGQMVIVSGEAGIGKSRITRAVIDEVSKDDHTRITYQCSPYHADSAFYPVIQQLSFASGLAPSDGPNARLDKLEALLGQDPETLKLITPMMGLNGTARYGALDLTPAQQRAHTMKTLANLLVQQSQDRPVLLVYEDLHWIDPTSLELLDLLLDTVADQKIMILATARPSFQYGFGGHPIVTRFALNRLGKDQIGDIVAKLTGGKALPEEIMAIIAERTDGVPLFVEELTKTILESGALKEDGDRLVLDGPLSTIAIPTTLHDSLMERLDRLQPIKEVAQTAACIGREFSHGLLAQISHLSEAELGTALDGLIAAELIYRRGLPPESTYLFKHALVRDAAYESLLKDRRRAVHLRILSALEGDADVAPEVLAAHAEGAELIDRAIDLWENASKVAFLRDAFEEAIAILRHAFILNKSKANAEEPEGLKRALSLQNQIASILLSLRGYAADETTQAYKTALSLAGKLGDSPLRFPALYGLWVGNLMTGKHTDGLKVAENVSVEAESSGVNVNKMLSARLIGVSSCMLGRFPEAKAAFKRALDLYLPAENVGFESRFGQDPGAATQAYQSLNFWCLGETQKSDLAARSAEDAALHSDHAHTTGYVHTHLALVGLLDRDGRMVHRHAIALREVGRKFGLEQMSVYADGFFALADTTDRNMEWVTTYEKFEAAYESLNACLYLPIFRGIAAWKALGSDHVDLCKKLAAKSRLALDETQENFVKSDLLHLEGVLALKEGSAIAAEDRFIQAIDVAQIQGAKAWELRAAIDLARLRQAQSRIKEAVAVLEPIHQAIAEGDCLEDQAAARKMLVELGK